MQLPVAIVADSSLVKAVYAPYAFTYGKGDAAIQHPITAWDAWTPGVWKAMCPDWKLLPIIDTPPEVGSTQRIERKPEAEWTITAQAVVVTYSVIDLTPEEQAAQDAATAAAAVIPVPASVTNFQARAALLQAGLFEVVNTALCALPVTSPAYQAWEYANDVTRAGTLVNELAGSLGISSEQMDDLFRAAAQIEA